MKKIALLVSLAATTLVSAQVSITDFSTATGFYDTGSWNGNLSFAGGRLTVGSPADDTGYFLADLAAPISGSTLQTVDVIARIDAGNLSNGFSVNFYDSEGIGVLTATFNASQFVTNPANGFATATAALSLYQGASTANVSLLYFGIAGAGSANAFRMTFDQIAANVPAAVPEPSTYAALVGALALGIVAYRRRLAA